VVDDFAGWRCCVCDKLRKNRRLQVIGIASDGLEAVLKGEELQPDLILLDVGLPKLDGIEAARQILKVSTASKILFLSQELDPVVVWAALSAGGHGYVVKSNAYSGLSAAVEAVMLGKRFVSPRFADHEDHNKTSKGLVVEGQYGITSLGGPWRSEVTHPLILG
jgi:DNA-binding NarL/FixJ family response regulator